jgi:hypothetical protein
LDTSNITNLSFAIFPIDDFTGKAAIGKVDIFLKRGLEEIPAILNPSGYYLFLDISGDTHEIIIKSDNYFEMSKTINLEEERRDDPSFAKHPVIPFALIPNSAYPFSSNTTLIRGTVKSDPSTTDGTEEPVSNADVKIDKKVGSTANSGKNISCKTDTNGDFVLFFKHLSSEDVRVEKENGVTKSFIIFEGGFTFKLIVEHDDYERYTTKSQEKLQEGKLRTIPKKILLTKR